jgi:hypothetical protein
MYCWCRDKENHKLVSTLWIRPVSDPDKGVCADPVDRGAILGRGSRIPTVKAGSISWLRTKEEGRRDT